MLLGKSREGRFINAKKRMAFIAADVLPVLCAIVLSRWAAADTFDRTFYVVDAIELTAGATNFALMSLNLCDDCIWPAGCACV